ncbi:MAG TPA: MoaD/ThiS family protein [Gemmatimonadaceae bacterium]|jgi:molybdopterin synthase sulfur carrier subunit|nr:MoaD/ThiS family protein [Gemmatimonadaceae bacterium]
MNVRVLLFASYADAAGVSELRVEVTPGATVGELVERVRQRLGSATLPPQPLVAVNQVYARADLRVAEADEVAIIPPVAGG